MNMTSFEDLKGKTLIDIVQSDSEEQVFLKTADLQFYMMYHDQDCCESVYVEDIVGDLEDLYGSPILLAEEVTEHGDSAEGSETWTFYKLATVKGAVTIRWYGSSNGYYSESVNFHRYIIEGAALLANPKKFSHLLTEEEMALLLLGQY